MDILRTLKGHSSTPSIHKADEITKEQEEGFGEEEDEQQPQRGERLRPGPLLPPPVRPNDEPSRWTSSRRRTPALPSPSLHRSPILVRRYALPKIRHLEPRELTLPPPLLTWCDRLRVG